MADRFTIMVGETQPSLSEQLFDGDGEPLDLTGATVKLRGRLSGTNTLLIDRAAAIDGDPTNGRVRYDWQAGDTAAAGNLIAWWYLTLAGGSQSTPEFVIPIRDQAAADPGVGVYATVLDVKALAGFLQDAFTPTSKPSEDDIRTYLAMVSGELDAALLSRGAVLPVDPAGAVALALRGLAADGALIRAINAKWPADAPGEALQLRADARARYAAGLAALVAGKHPAALALGEAATSDTASSLWTDEPSYGECGVSIDETDWNRHLAPSIGRGQRL